MRPIPSQTISKDALTVWRITGLIETIIYALLPIGSLFLVIFFQWSMVLFFVLAVAVVSIGILKIIVIPTVRWKRWRYEVYDQEIDLQFGIVVTRRVLIPMKRVQHVDTRQGPLLRKYDLATVTITTAATVHQIPALCEEIAACLRDQIAQLAAEAEDDV